MDASNSITVAVRVRPFTDKENLAIDENSRDEGLFKTDASLTSGSVSLLGRRSNAVRKIVQVLDERVLVFDPQNPITEAQRRLLGPSSRKVKDIRYCFDRVFDQTASQEEVYEGTTKPLVDSVLGGINSTVFAYGPTGAGKSHTICGTPSQPGIIFLVMQSLFQNAEALAEEAIIDVSISYLEIYNENIRDLLSEDPAATCLDLREEKGRVHVAGLSEHSPNSAEEVIRLIHKGNLNRTTHATDANQVSSRSHAVLSVNVKRRDRTANISEDYSIATLSVIDLAGSERASATNNKGVRLKEGSNINKSLLALGSCINALCQGGNVHVPYRNSRLTRLLRHSLGGNCKTVMITCISPSSTHYDETQNSLRYANRAKEIKTKVSRNVVSVDRHVSQYVKIIYELRQELEDRKTEDGKREQRIIENEKKQKAMAIGEVKRFFDSMQATRDDAACRERAIAHAKNSLPVLEKVANALKHWQQTALQLSHIDASDVTTTISTARQRFTRLQEDVRRQLESAHQGSKLINNARAMFDSNIANLRRRCNHADAQAAIDSEVQLFDLQMQLCHSQASLEGNIASHKVQMQTLAEIDAILLSLWEGDNQGLLEAVLHATFDLRRTLSGDEGNKSPATSLSAVAAKVAAFAHPKPRQQPPTSPRKAVLRSPRKIARTPVLKSSLMSSPRKRVLTQNMKKKSVVWLDEPATESEADSSFVEDETSAVNQSSLPEAGPSVSALSGISPSSDAVSQPALAGPSTPLSQNNACAKVRKSTVSGRMQSGFLSRGKAAESDAGDANMSKRKTFGVLSNASIPGTSGQSQSASAKTRMLRTPGAAGRRRSSLGPMRTVRKTKRISFIEHAPNPPISTEKRQTTQLTARRVTEGTGKLQTNVIPSTSNKENIEANASPTLSATGRLSPRKHLAPMSRLPSRTSLAPAKSNASGTDQRAPIWR